MKPDLSSRKDILQMITLFYHKLLHDKNMMPFFKDLVDSHQLKDHLEIVTDFWHDILFDTVNYKNNTMQKHLNKNTFMSFEKQHFDIWLSHLFETVDANFEGANVDTLKSRAKSIAMVMQLKMNVYKG